MRLNKKWLKRVHDFGLPYRVIVILIFLSLISTATEILGIGMFLPIFQFIRLEGDLNALVADSELWQYVINSFSYIGIKPSLLPLLLISFSLFIGRQAFVYWRLVYASTIRQRIIQMQQNRIFNKYIDADTSYHDNNTVSNLLNIIITEVSGAIVIIMAPLELIVHSIMLTGYLIVLIILSWEVTLFSVVVFLISLLVPSRWIKKGTIIGRKLVNANLSMSEFLVGRLRSPHLVRLSGTAEAEKKEFNALTNVQRKHIVSGTILQVKTDVAMEPIIVGLSLVLHYFSYSIFQLQIETIGIYLVIFLRLMPVVKGIIKQWQKIQRHLGSIEAIEARIELMQDSIEIDTGNISVTQLKKLLLINNVSYRYSASSNYVLEGVTIKFEKNKLVAIVGPSGSGKSTLIDLLPCLRLPEKGSIQIDGVDIKKYTLKSIRQMISYVPQFPQIFNGTIKNHILYGKIDATNEEILDAISLAGAKKFISQLPLGIETILGEDAINLSGGQRQRLDLARALIRKSPILILDEPTSNLDAESEEEFNKVLCKIRDETMTTVIIVSHRLISVTRADSIVVLNQGKVESIGTHSELLNQDGWYARSWEKQNIRVNL